jgi:hypothetical protein
MGIASQNTPKDATYDDYHQVGHGLGAVGTYWFVYESGSGATRTYVKAIANSALTAEAIGCRLALVTGIDDLRLFKNEALVQISAAANLPVAADGDAMWLSPFTAGLMTPVRPTNVGIDSVLGVGRFEQATGAFRVNIESRSTLAE